MQLYLDNLILLLHKFLTNGMGGNYEKCRVFDAARIGDTSR